VKTEVQADIDALKSALAGEDDAAVKTALDKLNESQQKLGEEIYAQSQAEAAAEDAAATDAPQGSDEDIVDAEVVDDEPTENKEPWPTRKTRTRRRARAPRPSPTSGPPSRMTASKRSTNCSKLKVQTSRRRSATPTWPSS